MRLQRLDKRRVEDDIKLIKDLDENRFPKKNEILNSLNTQIAEYKRRGIRKSPDIASMCEKFDELGVLNTSNGKESWKGMIYAELDVVPIAVGGLNGHSSSHSLRHL